jgi:hypothetical protein
MDELRQRRLAHNEAIARDVNEQVRQVASRWHNPGELIELICECSHEDCAERVHVILDDYQQVREDPTRFLVISSHVVPQIENVVGEAGDASVVEKVGAGRDVAREEA